MHGGARPASARDARLTTPTAEAVTAGIDLAGRTALVTGCTSGIGFETLRVLALRGARVIGTGRTADKAAAACDAVPGDTVPVALELGDYDNVCSAADVIRGLGPRLDIVILNAGIFAPPRLETVAGIERTFAINHLAHFILVNRIRRQLSAGSRLVQVSSRAAVSMVPEVGIDFDNLDGARGYDMKHAYGQSKLANALFAVEFSRRHASDGITCNAVHPGFVRTGIGRAMPLPLRALFTAAGFVAGRRPELGAATSCFVATGPGLDGVTGRFFADCREARYPEPNFLDNEAMAARLWEVSSRLAGSYLE
ncbi:MAG: SDR family NAD(P)-dependent oxidoreductase [Gammaproteobacteria bacterium]|nr:SDR family NAD(P)-dependent oxidoreductase [Gammaproteobacteria bacterium]